MAYVFEALTEFDEALEEVRILCRSAAKNTTNDKYYKAVNKSAVLLLTSKFESYLENVLEEYISFINSMNLSAKKIPNICKLNHTYPIINAICEQNDKYNRQPEMVLNLEEISKLWALHDEKFNQLNIQFKFNYGKHGEKEIVKLFNKIGIDNIFSEITIYEMSGSVSQQVDVKGRINSIVGIRNNIIHSDANPSLTHVQIKIDIKLLHCLAEEIVTTLNAKIANI